MPNVFKYSPGGSGPGTLKKGDFLIGNNTADYGGTYYTGITPATGGYTIYLNKATQGPSIFTAANDSVLIDLTNKHIAGNPEAPTGYTGADQCLEYFAGQTDKVCVNRDYEEIVIDGLALNLDAGFTPSYPKGGTSWYDISSNAKIGTLINGPAFSNSGGGSISFDGTDDSSSISAGLNGLTGFTINIWFYSNILANTALARGGSSIFLLHFRGAGFYLIDSSGTNSGYLAWDSRPPALVWRMLTGTWDGTTMKLYQNAVKQSTELSFTGTGVLGNIPTVFLGYYFNPTQPWTNGNISNSQIYNRALSDSEILQNYQALLPRYLGTNIVTSGLTLYTDAGYISSYPGSGTTLTNVAGTPGATGTLFNGVAYSSDNGGTFLYDGTDDFIQIANNNNLQPANSITLEVWFKSLGSNGRTQGLLYPNYGIGLRLDTTGVLNARVNSMGSIQFFTTSTTYFNSQWNMASMTLSTAGTITFYVNGSFVQQNSVSYDGNSPFNTSIGGIGTDANDGVNRGINGYIGPCKVYNRVLSAAEILQNFNAQKSRFGL